MSATPWVCGNCRSINQPREGRCYRCRTPRELVEADPETLIVAGVGASRAPEEIRPTTGYGSSAASAFMTQLAVAAGLVVTVVSSVMGADLVGRVLDGDVAATDTSFAVVGVLGVLGLGLGAAALVFWALWLSRVVANVPALGLGWPNVTPNQAIFESLIPVVNLYRVPAILRDVVNRLEPNGKGDAIIAAGWLGLVGGLLLPRALSWVIVFVAGSLEEFVTLRYVAGQLGLGLTVVGGIVLIYLVRWVEARMSARARSVEPGTAAAAAAAVPAATSAGHAPSAAPVEPVAGSHEAAPSASAAADAWSAGATAAAPDPAAAASSVAPTGPPSQPIGSRSPAVDAAHGRAADPPTPAAPPVAEPPAVDRPAPAAAQPSPAPPDLARTAPPAGAQPSPASPTPASPTPPPTAPRPADATPPVPRPSLAPTAHWTQAIPNRGTLPSLSPRPAPLADDPARPDAPPPDAPADAPRDPDG